MRPLRMVFAVLTMLSACTDVPTEPLHPAAFPDLAVVGNSTRISGSGVLILCHDFGCTLILQVTLRARLAGDGTVEGSVSVDNPSSSTAFLEDGQVTELKAPASDGDWWCMSGQFPDSNPGFNFLVYVRDVGDGKTTLDEVAVGGLLNGTCATRPTPDPLFGVSELAGGNFTGHVR